MSEILAVTDEIVRLHDFFQDWFNGVEGRSLDECAHALDDAFYIVGPRGTTADKDQVLAMIAGGGIRGPVEIRIESVELRRSDSIGVHIVTYVEHQKRPDESAVIISSAGLATDAACPGGYRWLFVHETWLSSPRLARGEGQAGTPSSR
jgi:hypothetical protein